MKSADTTATNNTLGKLKQKRKSSTKSETFIKQVLNNNNINGNCEEENNKKIIKTKFFIQKINFILLEL